jgi:hypothetical protein
MKFLMLVCGDPSIPPVPDPGGVAIGAWLAETHRRGIRLEGDRLCPVTDATTVREGGRLVTDGPFAETKEQIGGYDLLECADLAEAIEVAGKHPVAAFGAIELRPVWEED